MADNPLFTISGKTCSLVRRTSSSGPSPTDPAAASTGTALADVQTTAPGAPGNRASPTPTPTGARPSDSIDVSIVNPQPAETANADSNRGGNNGGDNKFNAGLVVGIVLALVFAIGIAAAMWLFMRRRRRRWEESNDESEKPPSIREDASYMLVTFSRRIADRASGLKAVVLARFRRNSDNDDQPRSSPFSNSAASSRPTAKRTLGFHVQRKGPRPLSDDTDHRDWFSNTLAVVTGKLFVTNPGPETPSESTNPFSDPSGGGPSRSANGGILGNPNLFARGRASIAQNFSRPRSSSLSTMFKDSTNYLSEPPPPPPINQDRSYQDVPQLPRQKHSRRSTDVSFGPFSNRGPSFYPPATGPLPTFDDIQASNPFADPVPAVPPIAAGAYSRPNHRRADTLETVGSSIIMLPESEGGKAYNFNGSRSSGNSSRLNNSNRASSVILSPMDPATPTVGLATAKPIVFDNRSNTADQSRNRPVRKPFRGPSNGPNPMAWKFPPKTQSGAGYATLVEPFKKKTPAKGNRDTTFTARSDPFDLEGRLLS